MTSQVEVEGASHTEGQHSEEPGGKELRVPHRWKQNPSGWGMWEGRRNKMKSERQAGDRRPGNSRAMADISTPFPAEGQPEVSGAGKLRNKSIIGASPVEMRSFKFGNFIWISSTLQEAL